jgi:hypothetical protein
MLATAAGLSRVSLRASSSAQVASPAFGGSLAHGPVNSGRSGCRTPWHPAVPQPPWRTGTGACASAFRPAAPAPSTPARQTTGFPPARQSCAPDPAPRAAATRARSVPSASRCKRRIHQVDRVAPVLVEADVSRTSAVIFSICARSGSRGGLALVVGAVWWFNTTAALMRLIMPVLPRTTRTVLSTS